MLYKRSDPQVTLSGLFASWQPATKAVYHVIIDVANFETGQFYHSVQKLAHLAGVSQASAYRALAELLTTGIIRRRPRPGKTTVYTYLFAANSRQGTPLTHETPPSHPRDTTPLIHETLTRSKKTNCLKQQQDVVFPQDLLDKLSREYGAMEVEKRVEIIAKMNGKVKNKIGLLVDSLKKGYIPTCKELREAEKARKRKEASRKAAQKVQEDLDRIEREAAEADPLVVAAAIREANELLGIGSDIQ